MEGTMDYTAIRTLLPYADDQMIAQIESAVLEGAFPAEVLDIVREYQEQQVLEALKK